MAVATTTVLAGLAIAATAAGTYVSYQGYQDHKQTAKEVARYNNRLAENAALQNEMESREASKRRAREGRRLLASQRAAIGKSGIAEAGSPLEVLGETAGMLQLEELDASRLAEQQRKELRARGAMGIYEGNQQAKAAGLAATGTILSGASNIASMGATMRYKGAI
jgi:hypothetical protein